MEAPAAWTGAGTLLGQKALLESPSCSASLALRERELQFHIYHFQASRDRRVVSGLRERVRSDVFDVDAGASGRRWP